MTRVLALLIGYLFGMFQTAYIYGRLHNIDIRNYGSGNAGTTNMMRTLGKKAGYITYFGDVIKVILAAVVVHLMFGVNNPDIDVVLTCYAGFGAILGHNFPFYLNFKGGKGVAATSGLMLTFIPYNPWLTISGYLVFFTLMYLTKYVSFASLTAILAFGIEFVAFNAIGDFTLDFAGALESDIIIIIIVVLVFVRHKDNLKRLNEGTERKIGEKRQNN